jgi:hypothetical protein
LYVKVAIVDLLILVLIERQFNTSCIKGKMNEARITFFHSISYVVPVQLIN